MGPEGRKIHSDKRRRHNIDAIGVAYVSRIRLFHNSEPNVLALLQDVRRQDFSKEDDVSVSSF
jgi:hypothetical protein